MMVKNFHQAPAEITTWWWVMKNQAWYAAELMSRCAVCWSAIRAPGERRARLPDTWGMHLRHSVTLTQKQAGQAAVHKSSVMEAVKRTAPDPKQHLFFFKNAGGFLIAASEDEITFIDDFTADWSSWMKAEIYRSFLFAKCSRGYRRAKDGLNL